MEFINTYVRGLDERIEGGIPKSSVILISGPTGSMKSSFSFYIAYNYLKDKKKEGMLFTFLWSRAERV